MLGQTEFQSLFAFFTTELPKLALLLCGLRSFPSVEKLFKQHQYKDKKPFDVKAEYLNVPPKHQILLKTYAANYNRLLNQALTELETNHVD
jgi:hypothetical protein